MLFIGLLTLRYTVPLCALAVSNFIMRAAWGTYDDIPKNAYLPPPTQLRTSGLTVNRLTIRPQTVVQCCASRRS